MTDCATKRLWMAEAELALHQLLTGQREVKLTFGTAKGVEYNQTNISELRAYIATLTEQVRECDGQPSGRRGPVRFAF